MFKHLKKLLSPVFGITSLFANHGKTIKINVQVDIWYETFGRKDDPACLLIMGAGGPGLFWSTEFCEKLAQKRFYVIRYDHRDTGFSTFIDFAKNPYTLLDMAKDAIDLLDTLHVQRAHLVGLSMGGPIAELISIHDPQRTQSLTLIATSSDFRPSNLSLAGMFPEKGSLSSPQECYQRLVKKLLHSPPKTQEEQQALQEEMWRVLNGPVTPLDEKKSEKEKKQLALRLKKTSMNHMSAVQASEAMICGVPSQVVVPTLILHGTEDPIFGVDHAEALSLKIKDAKIYLIQGMGHVLNSQFSDLIIDKIAENAFYPRSG